MWLGDSYEGSGCGVDLYCTHLEIIYLFMRALSIFLAVNVGYTCMVA